jgi:hypothetical protein
MRLTIKNIYHIEDRKLPKLDGYTISWGKTEEHEYEFDVFYNYTVKMVIKVNRDSNYDGTGDKNNYTCIITAGGIYNNHKWQIVVSKDELKTKMGFLMVASEMVNKILLQQANEQKNAGNNRITQSYNRPAGFKI